MTDVVVAEWDLSAPAANAPSTESAVLLDYSNPTRPVARTEASFYDDSRTPVREADFQEGGKYRSIVKLFIRYEFQEADDEREAIGTGWLIRPDVLVTAGHCAYDWNSQFGRAVSVRAYIGYKGKSSIGSPSVQFRTAKTIVTTVGWLRAGTNKNNDLAFVQLDKPFTNVVPFKVEDTPINASKLEIGVVGYPGDKEKDGERGAEMYEMYKQVTFDRASTDLHMLDYTISTYAGQSGSPVVRRADLTALAAHTYGGRKVNSATPFGYLGNDFQAYANYFNPQYAKTPVVQGTGISVPKVPGANMLVLKLADVEIEGFFGDLLSKAIKVVAPVAAGAFSQGVSSLGPIGAALAPLAGVALNAAANLAGSGIGTESTLAGSIKQKGVVERALLGEAALTAITSFHPDDIGHLNLVQKMKAHLDKTKAYSTVKPVSPFITKALVEPAYRIALANVAPKKDKPEASMPRSFKITAIDTESSMQSNPTVEQLIDALNKPTAVVDDGGPDTEGFFDTIGGIISTGLRYAPTVISSAAKGLNALADFLPKTESGLIDATSQGFDGLTERALLGEAALQAIIDTPVKELEELRDHDGDTGTESLLGAMKAALQTIGPYVTKAAPFVLKAVTPLVQDMIAPKAENRIIDTPAAEPPKSKAPAPEDPKLRNRKSMHEAWGQFGTKPAAVSVH